MKLSFLVIAVIVVLIVSAFSPLLLGNQLGQSWTLDKAGVVGGVKAGDQLGVGSQRTASIHLSLVANFPVTFKERGLLSGSTWNVTLHGVTENGLAGKAITFSEPNGTYSYTLTGPHGYQLLSPGATGTVTVNGNPNTVVVSSIVVGSGPYGVAYDASNKYLYVANPYSNNVSVINGVTNKVVSSIKVGTTPYGVAYDASNGYLYVTNYNSNNVSVINGVTNKAMASSIGAGNNPWGVVYDPSNGYLYVANSYSCNVSVINGVTNKVVSSITVGSGPREITYDPSNEYLYVVNDVSCNVTVINGATDTVAVSSITVGSYPVGIAYDASNGYLYVTNYGSNSVTVINGATNKVVSSITVGAYPWGIAYDSSNGYLYVTNSGSNNVTVINGATNTVVVSSITVGASPYGIAYDASNGYLYVTNYGSDSVTVINGNGLQVTVWALLYHVIFTETGLPAGTTWYVNISNGISSGAITGTSHSFSLINGTYSYSIATVNKSWHSNGSSFTVNGPSAPQSITFSLVKYAVTFTETGLPSGITWYVNITGHDSGAITGLTYFVMLTNGTYAYTIQTNNKIYEPSPSSGPITVNGGPKSVSVTFSLVKYAVTFTETGLPSGITWYVNLSNGQSFSSTGTSISFSEPNGTYAYSIATVNKSWHSNGSSFTVNGPSAPQSITFSLVKYTVTLTETGLPSGITWYVNITGHDSGAITGLTYFVMLTNGTYAYTIQT
ncbi:MAG: beta-propeller fold lactonase family protein, partial [Cuniculiplasma sp.]